MKKAAPFESEAALCLAFSIWARAQGLVVYPETGGWDLLLVAPSGAQTGVQAKLRLNLDVLTQAIDHEYLSGGHGPDHRAVLVPEARWSKVPALLGLTVYEPERRPGYPGIEPPAVLPFRAHHPGGEPLDWNPKRRVELPDYVPDVPAGVPSPVQLTPWKIGALRLLARLELHGSITRKDFRDCDVNPSRWYTLRWVVPKDPLQARGAWLRGEECPAFDQQHPDTYAKILAETKAQAAA